MHFVTRTEQGREMEAVVLYRVGFLAYSCPKQSRDFKPSAGPLCPNMGQVPFPPRVFGPLTTRLIPNFVYYQEYLQLIDQHSVPTKACFHVSLRVISLEKLLQRKKSFRYEKASLVIMIYSTLSSSDPYTWTKKTRHALPSWRNFMDFSCRVLDM